MFGRLKLWENLDAESSSHLNCGGNFAIDSNERSSFSEARSSVCSFDLNQQPRI